MGNLIKSNGFGNFLAPRDMFSRVEQVFKDTWDNTLLDFFGDRNELDLSKVGYPRIDAYNKDNNLYIEATIPGLSKENVDVSWDNNILTISGKSSNSNEVSKENFHIKEIHKSSFKRSFKLNAEDYELDKINASVNNGILKLQIPCKKKEVKDTVKRIEIK